MTTDIESSEVVFFMGAGASVAAGVPDTYSFVEQFIESIEDLNKKETIEKIVQTLKKWKGTEIDIELLLETLIKLRDRKFEPLLKFYQQKEFILKGYSNKKPLIDNLKDFIKRKAIVSEENKIQYFQPLLGFVEEFKVLDIISLNYDTCVEQFCNIHKLSYQDGFDVYWNPKNFTTENTDIRLYKLHGSVMWYQSDRGGYIKLPVMTEKSKITLISGEKAENLMLYPMQKWDFPEPLLELLVETKRLLESGTCKFLIVVGYSFRDYHIRRILWDVARKNKDLHIILIGPKAYQIYFEKLKYYDESNTIPSSLDGKVICLPYKFEKVFPHLKNYYLTNLRVGLSCETTQHQTEIQGNKVNWENCLNNLVNAEYTDKVEKLLEKIDPIELERNWQRYLELYLKMTVNLSSNNREEEAEKYLKIFIDDLYSMMVDRININVINNDIFIEINYYQYDSDSSFNSLRDLKKVFENLSYFCESRKDFVKQIGENFQKIITIVANVKEYFEPFNDTGIFLKDYISFRKEKISDDKIYNLEFINNVSQRPPMSNDNISELISNIKEIETSILKEIII